MRSAVAVIVVSSLVLASSAIAAPAAPAAPQRVTWADWVGTYDGSLVWRNCTAPGAPTAALTIDVSDGVLAIDLTAAGAALRPMSLVEDETGWSAQQGDVKVRLTRPRGDSIALALELDSGCTMKGKLRRKTTTIAPCDLLIGWARIESRCTKLHDAALEDLAKLEATRWRKADATSCTARAGKLELALVDAGCAPHPDPTIGVRAPSCIALSNASAGLWRCGTVPQAVKDAAVNEAAALSSAAQSAEPATLPYVEAQCRDAKSTISGIAVRFHCVL